MMVALESFLRQPSIYLVSISNQLHTVSRWQWVCRGSATMGTDYFVLLIWNLPRVCYLDGNNHQALRLMAKVIFPGRRWCSCVQCPRQDLKESRVPPHCQCGGKAPPPRHRSALNKVPKKASPCMVYVKQSSPRPPVKLNPKNIFH